MVKNVQAQIAGPRTWFNHSETCWFIKDFPHLLDLSRHYRAKNRVQVRACVKVSIFANACIMAAIVTHAWKIERHVHKLFKTDWPAAFYVLLNNCFERHNSYSS